MGFISASSYRNHPFGLFSSGEFSSLQEVERSHESRGESPSERLNGQDVKRIPKMPPGRRGKCMRQERSPLPQSRSLCGSGDRLKGGDSEVKLQCELDVAFVLRAQELSELSAGHASVGSVKYRCICEVNSLSTELKALGFGNRKVLLDSKIPVSESRPAHSAVGATAEGSDRRHRKGRCAEPCGSQTYPVRIRIWTNAVCFGASAVGLGIVGPSNCEREASVVADDPADLPIAQNRSSHWICMAAKTFPGTVRQLIDIGEDKVMGGVKVCRAPLCRLIIKVLPVCRIVCRLAAFPIVANGISHGLGVCVRELEFESPRQALSQTDLQGIIGLIAV